MATPKQFAIQQVLKLLLRRPSDKKLIGYLTNLKTSGLENTMEMVYPTGGAGNVYIGQGFAHSKRASLNVEAATWNTEVMAAQNGMDIITPGKTTVVEYDVIAATPSGSSYTYATKYKAKGVTGAEIAYVYAINEDGTAGTAYTQSTATTPATGSFKYDSTSKAITFAASDLTALAGGTIACVYERETADDAQVITMSGTAIPRTVLATGYGVVVDICSNEAFLCQFDGKAQIDGNYTFDLAADGDPSVHSLNLEFVRDCNTEDLYRFVIYSDKEGSGS